MNPLSTYPFQSQLQTGLHSLEKLSKQKTSHNIFKRILSALLPFYDRARTFRALRTQEHLIREGSIKSAQKNAFLDAIREKKTPGFMQLRKELSSLDCRIFTSPFPKSLWERNQIKKIEKLKNKESMWLDSSILGHCLLMRVTKHVQGKQESYTVQFANTGLGLEHHPRITLPNGKVVSQTLLEYQNISKDVLLHSHFLKSIEGELESKLPHSIYKKLETLGKPTKIVYQKNSPYFSKPQLGESCVPSSMWTLAKQVLSPDEYKELRNEMRMTALVKEYRRIKNGWDQSSTAKILALDQVQRIQGTYKRKSISSPAVLHKIKKELLGELKMNNIEMKIKNPSKIKGSSDKFLLYPQLITLTAKTQLMSYKKSIKKMKNGLAYDVSRDPKTKQLHGKDLCDNLYLLYYNIANGNANEIYQCMANLRKEDLANINSLKKSDPKKIKQTAELLIDLAWQFRTIDRTRSGIAKSLFLATLGSKLSAGLHDAELEKKANVVLRRTTIASKNLNIDLYLPEDNLWREGLRKL